MAGVIFSLMDSAFDTILVLLCVIVLIGVLVMIIDRFALKSRLSNKLFHRDLKIEKNANVITEIKKIAQLVCMSYYEEQLGILERREDGEHIVEYNQGADNDYECLVMKYNGLITVGVDLSKITDKDIKISGNSLKAKIPHSEVFEIRINPSDSETICEEGDWDGEKEKLLYCHTKEELEKHAIDEGIFKRSDEVAINNLSEWFKAFGFKDVNIYMEKTTEVKNS